MWLLLTDISASSAVCPLSAHVPTMASHAFGNEQEDIDTGRQIVHSLCFLNCTFLLFLLARLVSQ